jgi:hypothetical protein
MEESDPDALILRRHQDGSFVAAFSVSGATREGIVEAATEDYQALLVRMPIKRSAWCPEFVTSPAGRAIV